MNAHVLLGHADAAGVIDDDCMLRLALIRQLRPKLLVLAGGAKSTHPITEAAQMHALLRADIDCPIILEEFSRTTAENAWCCVELLGEAQTVTLVCSRAHALRSWIFFRLALNELGHRRTRIRFALSSAPSWRSWIYEARYLHHIPRNVRAARARRLEMLAR